MRRSHIACLPACLPPSRRH
uniref:Uncharacterized protein n=1 Tax=Anguilla anguilla TaxID=7936 RepID=A0A0E9VCG2_ANGAN